MKTSKTSKTFTVYRHITPDGKSYIGCTCKKPEYRWNNGKGYKDTLFGKAIEECGWDNIKHEILDTNLDEFEAKCLEEYYIFSFRTFVGFSDCNGYNCNLGGDGQVGMKYTKEEKMKMSASHKGKHHNDETKRKQSEAHKGDKHHMYGKHHSPETCKKISDSLKGQTAHNKGKHLVMIDVKRHYE